MTESVRKVLVATASLPAGDRFSELLAKLGFQAIIAPSPAAVRAQCQQHDFDLIITGPPATGTAEHFPELGYPDSIPLLCLSATPLTRDTFNGILCTLSTTDDHLLVDHLETLSQIRGLQRQVVEKERIIKSLDQALQQQQLSMKQHNELLDVLASRDGLTGLFNRRQLSKVLSREFEHYFERDTDLSIVLLDLDFFDELNRKTGRSYGDFVLNDFAARLTSLTTPKGICFRFSGEVFIALLTETSLSDAMAIAETIRQNLADKPFVRGNEHHHITVSIGVASLIEHQPEDPDHFVTMAERALFTAKSEGRNRVAAYQSSDRFANDCHERSMAQVKQSLTKLLDKTKKAAIESLQLLARDIAGRENQAHIKNVRRYTELIGRQMNLPEPVISTFTNAIALHTSIRLLLHNEMINKRQEFSSDERELMNDFPYKLLELTELFDFFSSERMILLHHAERYDGYGSPEGLKGDEIPLGARLFTLVDALAAMNADRPYRKRLAPDEIVTQLKNSAGAQFDPELVIRTLATIKVHRLLPVATETIDQALASLEEKFSGRPV